MNQKLTISPTLMLIAVLCQLGMGLICGYLMYDTTHQPKAWALDSTQYYKFLEGQGKLNLKVYQQQQAHEERLHKLDKKREASHRHIDSLSGDALQREIDRQYNNRPGRQQPARSGAGPGHPDQTDQANRGSGPTGAQRQSRPADSTGGHLITRYPAQTATGGLFESGSDDPATQRTAAASGQSGRAVAGPVGHDVPQTARSALGKLAGSAGSGGVRSRQTQTNLTYWQRIRAQGYTYPDVAWAISAVETGYWWTRPPGHNLFGFRKNSRHFYASVSAGGYCRYASETQSLADYGAYEQSVIKKYKLHSRADYLAHIHRRYCPSPQYPGKLVLAFRELNRIRTLA